MEEERRVKNDVELRKPTTLSIVPRSTGVSEIEVFEKGYWEYLDDAGSAQEELNSIIVAIGEETGGIGERLAVHAEKISQAKASGGRKTAKLVVKALSRAGEDITATAWRTGELATQALHAVSAVEVAYSGVLRLTSVTSQENREGLLRLRDVLANNLKQSASAKEITMRFRDVAISLAQSNLEGGLTTACSKLAGAQNQVIEVIEQYESLALKAQFQIDERLGSWGEEQLNI
jgi:hypothetical protein